MIVFHKQFTAEIPSGPDAFEEFRSVGNHVHYIMICTKVVQKVVLICET